MSDDPTFATSGYVAPASPPPVKSRWAWLKRPLPLWVAIVTLFAGVAAGSAGGSSSKEDKQTAAAVATVTTVRVTTTLRPTTTTQRSTTTTTQATTTTAVDINVIWANEKAAMTSVFEEKKAGMATELEGSVLEIDSIDRLLFDTATDTVYVSATSSFNGQEYHIDGAWGITRYLADIWTSFDVYFPNLDVTVASVHYFCPGPFMKQLSDLSADQAAWEATCRA